MTNFTVSSLFNPSHFSWLLISILPFRDWFTEVLVSRYPVPYQNLGRTSLSSDEDGSYDVNKMHGGIIYIHDSVCLIVTEQVVVYLNLS